MRVLLAGESWVSTATHIKGFDQFSSVTFHTGADAFIAAAAECGVQVTQMYAHDVPTKFPRTAAALSEWEVIILSDIGFNSFQLPPETWLSGKSAPNALANLADWTRGGGGLMMAGGYLSFQGFQARANFANSPLAEVLPVTMDTGDDRREISQGAAPRVVDPHHPLGALWVPGAPSLLGYNHVIAKDGADTIATVDDDVLVAAWQVGSGRALVWTSDIGPHWCPDEFLAWEGFGPLMAGMITWLGGGA